MRTRAPARCLGLVVAVAVTTVMPASPAQATEVAHIDLAFYGFATVNPFPCYTTPPTVCTGGSFSGWASGSFIVHAATGDAAGTLTNADVSAMFHYREDSGSACALGGAGGRFTLTASNGTTVPQTIGVTRQGFTTSTTASVTFASDFQWGRIGSAATIFFGPDSDIFVTPTFGTLIAMGSPPDGTLLVGGAAVFVPMTIPLPGACTPGGAGTGPITALVAGTASLNISG
jgi:hypothetical protein